MWSRRSLSPTDAEIRARLLAAKTNLSLPSSTIFERLSTQPVEVMELRGKAQKLFLAHLTYRLPCEDASHLHDTIHRFVLRFDHSTKLNEAVLKWALHKEAKAASLSALLDPPEPGRGSDAGYRLSNQGGFQSYPDIFDANPRVSEDDDDELAGREAARLLHMIASRAVNEIDGCGAPTKLRGAYGWLNVNRPGDYNSLHTHPKNRWSAVYYVDSGKPQLMTRREVANGSDDNDDVTVLSSDIAGHLVFRGGSRTSPTVRSYLALPPVPGILCLFPGSIPHCVLDNGPIDPAQSKWKAKDRGIDGQCESCADSCPGPSHSHPRISIAMNFRDAAPPPPSTT